MYIEKIYIIMRTLFILLVLNIVTCFGQNNVRAVTISPDNQTYWTLEENNDKWFIRQRNFHDTKIVNEFLFTGERSNSKSKPIRNQLFVNEDNTHLVVFINKDKNQIIYYYDLNNTANPVMFDPTKYLDNDYPKVISAIFDNKDNIYLSFGRSLYSYDPLSYTINKQSGDNDIFVVCYDKNKSKFIAKKNGKFIAGEEWRSSEYYTFDLKTKELEPTNYEQEDYLHGNSNNQYNPRELYDAWFGKKLLPKDHILMDDEHVSIEPNFMWNNKYIIKINAWCSSDPKNSPRCGSIEIYLLKNVR